MKECHDKDLGQLLHDYELGLLSEDDSHRFEMHLYECDFCLDLAREFMEVPAILTKDPDALDLIKIIADEPEAKKEKGKFSPFFKLLIAAILVIVIAVPVYKFGIHKESPAIVQTLEFLPSRAGGSDIIYLEKGGDAVINFFISENYKGSAKIVISKVSGDTILSLPDFNKINDHGMGTITVPVADFTEGHYVLQVIPTKISEVSDRLYMFRVK